ncbi:MAG TPA: hypothetical protein DD671_16080 [Balneolaceae bacterium]|nr:hypothetical protein [Balneolaceae bacterium]
MISIDLEEPFMIQLVEYRLEEVRMAFAEYIQELDLRIEQNLQSWVHHIEEVYDNEEGIQK